MIKKIIIYLKNKIISKLDLMIENAENRLQDTTQELNELKNKLSKNESKN